MKSAKFRQLAPQAGQTLDTETDTRQAFCLHTFFAGKLRPALSFQGGNFEIWSKGTSFIENFFNYF